MAFPKVMQGLGVTMALEGPEASPLAILHGLMEVGSVHGTAMVAALEMAEAAYADGASRLGVVITGIVVLMAAEGALAQGHFYAPTIVSGVTPKMRIYREETFGPVAPVITYRDEDDLIALANDTEYGLAAYVYSDRLDTCMRAFEGLDFGIIGINDINPTSAAAPFGGMKASGMGREGAQEGIAEYLETKTAGMVV